MEQAITIGDVIVLFLALGGGTAIMALILFILAIYAKGFNR